MNGRTRKLLPFMGMIVAVLTQSGSMVVIKVAMKDGMNKYVMVVYSMALSSIMLLPLAFFIHRTDRPPLTFSSLCSFFLLALFGMEILNWRHCSSQAKVIGTIVSMAGAFVVIFYKGPPIFKIHSSNSFNTLQFSPQLNWIMGGLLCAGDSLFSAIWYIYQVSVTKKYPAVIVIVFFQVFFIAIQSGVFALIVVRDPSAWELKLDMRLIVIFYQAIAAIGIRYLLQTWCVQRAGPLFCAMFKPVGIIFTVIMGSIFLGEVFNLGSLIGAVIIVVGFYAVQWGKASEQKSHNFDTSSNVVPLLQNKA
ncbi:WAT1-related protein At3g28070-like isoform X3 [Cicer arietinum]|uniref:WAT1-related protein n=1 Tax=Cicer arietinum TaxID=3827 RepID=A0A3Q7XL93_CICAR|nr:WAT1-related protein At3g28070-like isoform X3 [Cicer arietinum]